MDIKVEKLEKEKKELMKRENQANTDHLGDRLMIKILSKQLENVGLQNHPEKDNKSLVSIEDFLDPFDSESVIASSGNYIIY